MCAGRLVTPLDAKIFVQGEGAVRQCLSSHDDGIYLTFELVYLQAILFYLSVNGCQNMIPRADTGRWGLVYIADPTVDLLQLVATDEHHEQQPQGKDRPPRGRA